MNLLATVALLASLFQCACWIGAVYFHAPIEDEEDQDEDEDDTE